MILYSIEGVIFVSTKKSIMKIALFFDIFAERGGSERVAIDIAKELNADIYTTHVDWKNSDEDLKKLKIKETGLLFKNSKLLTCSEIAFRFSMLKVKGYDVCLFTRIYSIAGAKNHHPNIWICNSPNRTIYDLHETVYKRLSFWQKPIFKLWCFIYSYFDKMWVKNFDKILSNSKNTEKRLKRYYNIETKILYHPVDTKRFKYKTCGDFYLTINRLTREKRVDLVIKAFKKMPDKILLVVGDGPEKNNLINLAKEHKNIKFLGNVSLDKKIELYSECIATIYMPIDEDYGLIPLESMASGKPCIAVNEGGCKETVIHGKTGFLIKPQTEEIIKYVNHLKPEIAKKMKNDCMEQAKNFDLELFILKLKKEVNHLLKVKK